MTTMIIGLKLFLVRFFNFILSNVSPCLFFLPGVTKSSLASAMGNDLMCFSDSDSSDTESLCDGDEHGFDCNVDLDEFLNKLFVALK